MTHSLKTTLAVTFVIFLISVWALEAKIAEKRNKLSSLDTADTKVGGFPLRIKRRFLPIGLMILCKTKRSPSDYYGYGCYCRKGGGRGEPVDNIDVCCQAHDECYDRIVHEKLCASDLTLYYKGYKREGCSGCDSSRNDECEMAICNCDSVAARCMARYEYNSEYRSYPQEKCL